MKTSEKYEIVVEYAEPSGEIAVMHAKYDSQGIAVLDLISYAGDGEVTSVTLRAVDA